MPFYEYQCSCGERFTKFFTTISAGAEHIAKTQCTVCTLKAPRVMSTPLQAHLYGDPTGYHNPSPTKRFSTKLASEHGNANSFG